MRLGNCAKTLVRLALLCFAVAAFGFVWEILAAQAPTSPYHVGILPGPVEVFRNAAFALGLIHLILAMGWEWASEGGDLRWHVRALIAGTVLTLVALAYAATTGMKGVQIHDPRVDAAWLFRVRAIGALILGIVLFDLARRVWRALRKD